MVQQLSRFLVLGLAVVGITGCGSKEPPVAQDPPEVKAAVEQSASQVWTPEKQEAYRNAMSGARSEGAGPVAPNSMNGGGYQPAPAPDNSAPAYQPPTGGATSPSYNPAPSTQPEAPRTSVPSGRPDDIGSTGSDPMVGK